MKTKIMPKSGVPEQLGKYTIKHELGKGSSGIVYLAEDPFEQRKVAVKVYTSDADLDASQHKIQRKLFFNLERERKRLEAEGFSPAPKLLAQNLGVKEEEVVEMQQRMSSRDLSVDTPINNADESSTLLDLLADPHATAEEEVSTTEYRSLIGEKMAAFALTLTGKEEVIFNQRLLAEEPLTLQEIGDQYSISRERVRQLESRLKKKLKAYLLQEFKNLEDLDVGLTENR